MTALTALTASPQLWIPNWGFPIGDSKVAERFSAMTALTALTTNPPLGIPTWGFPLGDSHLGIPSLQSHLVP